MVGRKNNKKNFVIVEKDSHMPDRNREMLSILTITKLVQSSSNFYDKIHIPDDK
jgi:hypothetical protein